MRVFLIVLAGLLAGCGTIPPPDMRAHYEVEAASRRMEPQSEVALLYLLPSRSGTLNGPAVVKINGDMALADSGMNDFYVYCLPAGAYDVQYGNSLLARDVAEFLTAKAGEIYVRRIDWSTWSLSVHEVDEESARPIVESRRLGHLSYGSAGYTSYGSSRYRCPALKGPTP